ncbi:hypothetical protein TNCV_1246991 [Trichonephila clavipes]|uniref:Uncharacterized protein n=1 Tax=Trichonephila clavipes TaxID=2585209 RepID=A0A8X6RFI7_TRICX|nr:hypothetical protein TNCV_1246991 [Trichonephila clavipes]
MLGIYKCVKWYERVKGDRSEVLWDLRKVTIEIAFQASITAEVSACSEDGRFSWLRNLRFNSFQRYNAVTKETFAAHPPNPDAAIRLPDCKARFITPKNSFPHVHSPMMVSSTPLQSMFRIQWSDIWLVSGCTTMGSHCFLTLDGQSCC